MKLFVAAITFGVTIGGLFLFDTTETQKKSENTENYAQIIKELNGQNQSKNPTPKPENKSSKITTKVPTPSSTPSFTATLITSLPSASPTPLPILSPTATTIPAESIQSTPTPQSAQQNDQITVISLTPPPPIKQNSAVQLDIKTAPEARCTIKVTLPSDIQSTAKGLEDKTADSFGDITWSWRINWNTTPGTANIDLACSKDGQGFSKSLQMIIIER